MKELIQKYNVLIKNFFSLSILNVINFLTPLITLPYLIQVLGVENYGKYSFIYSLLLYVNMLVNFGFQFSATKEVSIYRSDNKKVSSIFSEVVLIRFSISIISITTLFFALNNIPKYEDISYLFLSGSGIAVGTSLMPNFIYQGMEKMKYILISTSIPKIVMISSIFFLIKSPNDIQLLMIIQSFGFISAGIISSLIAIKIFNIKFVINSISDLIERMRSSIYLFMSTVGISLYRESGIILLGLLTNYEVVGYYSAAEKIIRAIQAILNPIAQSLFPHFAKEFNSNDEHTQNTSGFIKFVKYYSLLLITVVIGVIFIIPLIITYFTGDQYSKSLLDIKLLSPVILFGSLNFVVGIVGLVNFGYQKYFTKTILTVGVFGIILSYILAIELQDYGVAIAVSLVEFLIFIFLIKKLWSLK